MGATLHHGARASHYHSLSCCRAQAPDAQAQYLWLMGLVAPQHVGSSQTRARTRVPCIGRQILNHCATREAPWNIFYKVKYLIFEVHFLCSEIMFYLLLDSRWYLLLLFNMLTQQNKISTTPCKSPLKINYISVKSGNLVNRKVDEMTPRLSRT